MNIVQKMEALADEWHCGVERKGKGHVPYIAHPRAVVTQLKAWGMTEEANPVPLAVAWGHDLVEDTRVPAISILNAAGEHGIKVFEGILYLTFSRPEYPSAKDHDDADRLYMERLAREAPPEILMVKLADRVCNTRDFMKDPPKALPVPFGANPFFSLVASMTPARDVGGDFYDSFMLDATHLAFMVADVSGKGVTAALYMMTAKTLLKDAILSRRDPAAAFTRVNAELCRSNTANMFLTAWCGVLDLVTGQVTFANAGHNPPMKVEARGTEGSKSKYITEKSGPVLAFLDGIEYTSFTFSLSPGDLLFLYTDGVTEALDSKGSLFGEERLENAVNVVAKPNPKSVCNVVRMAVAAFAEGVPQADDLTVLAVEYVSRPQRLVGTFPATQDGIAAASAFLDDCVEKISEGRHEPPPDAGREVTSDLIARLPSLAPALHVILDEMCSNIVKHSGASGFEVDVEMLAEPCGIKLTFVDDGSPYDPLSHEDPDTALPAEKRPIGGLGIMMVKKMADFIHYERKHDRNFLTVVKR